jgi:glycosyltransferase involved in cell wall biosynthesis
MKILLVVHQFFPEYRTGTEVLTLELARGLLRKGHHVEILTGTACADEPAAKPPWLTETAYDGITVHRVNYSESALEPVALHSSDPARVELVRRVVSRAAPEIVHVNHFLGLSSGIIPAIRALHTPVVYTATDFWAICPQFILLHTFDGKVCSGPGSGLDCIRCCVSWFSHRPAHVAWIAKSLARTGVFRSRWTMREVESLTLRPKAIAAHVNTSNMIISATKFLADMLVRNGIAARLIRIIPYGVDIGGVAQRREVPLRFTPATPLRLAFMGTMTERKGPHVILDALAALGDRAREIELRLYGEGNRDNPYFRGILAKTERLGGSAVMMGTFPHDRIGEVMSDQHLLIVPSLWYESTPLVLCSALGAGIPALVSRLGGMTEIIEEGVNGMSFPAGDAIALKGVLLRLLDAPEILTGMHRTTVARRRFTADYVEDIEVAYRDVRLGKMKEATALGTTRAEAPPSLGDKAHER